MTKEAEAALPIVTYLKTFKGFRSMWLSTSEEARSRLIKTIGHLVMDYIPDSKPSHAVVGGSPTTAFPEQKTPDSDSISKSGEFQETEEDKPSSSLV